MKSVTGALESLGVAGASGEGALPSERGASFALVPAAGVSARDLDLVSLGRSTTASLVASGSVAVSAPVSSLRPAFSSLGVGAGSLGVNTSIA